MAAVTLERLAEGIRRANAAGDVETVKKLGLAYRQMQGQPNPAFAAASEASQALKGPVPQKPETYGESHVAQGMSGLNEGIGMVLGAPVDLATGVVNLGIAGANALGADVKPISDPVGGSGMFNRWMGSAGAITPETNDPAKQMIRRTAQDVGAAAIPVLGTMNRVARPAAAVAKELALSIGSGGGAALAQQMAPDNPWAELAGQILGGASVAGATGAVKRAITPFPNTSPERVAAAARLRNEGVELTAGQQTGSKGLQYAEAELGGGRVANLTEQQAEQFTSAALARIGERATRASPEVLDRAYTRIGGDFEDVATRNSLRADRQLAADLRTTWQDYAGSTAPGDRAPNVEGFITDIAEAIRTNNGVLDGRTYGRLRSRLGQLARKNTNPYHQEALYGIQHALDDAMERNMSPDDIDLFRNARREYRDFIVIEQAATAAGENAALGLISPAQLRQATVTKQGRRNYARGDGDFADLARDGIATMTPLPQSGTTPRAAVRVAKGALPFIGATVAGGGTLGVGALAGAAAGAAIPWAAGRAMLSGPGRRYLSNQVISGAPSGSNGIGPVAAALADRTSELPELTAGQATVLKELIAREPLRITVRGGANSRAP